MSTTTQSVYGGRLGSLLGITTVVFIASKATAFLAPMLLARSMPVADYGTVELALAWGTPSALICGMGITAAIPYFLLKLDRPESRRVFHLHVAVVGLLLLSLALLCRLGSLPIVATAALLVAAIFMGQNLYGALLRSDDRPAFASFMDVSIYCVLFVVVGVLMAVRVHVTLPLVVALLVAITVTFIGTAAMLYRQAPVLARLKPLYREVVEFGLPIILTGFLSMMLLSGGRILIGAFLGVTDVAIYSLLFRMAAAAVLMHQLPTTMFFSRIYTGSGPQLNRYLALIQFGVLVAALSIWLVGWPVGEWLFPVLRQNSTTVHSIMLVVTLQMFYWCVAAETEFIFYRENWRKRYLVWLSTAFAVLVAGTFALKFAGLASLLTVSQWLLVVMFVTAMGNMTILWKSGIRMPAPMALSTITFAGYWFLHGLHPALPI